MISETETGSFLPATPSQTAGPFFHIGLDHLCDATVIAPAEGDAVVTIHGEIVDGDGAVVPDAVVEVWHTTDEVTRGFARVYTDERGQFSFRTVRPRSATDGGPASEAPHLAMLVFMRGLLKPVATRMYFPGDSRNETDPVLSTVPPARRGTLVAREESLDMLQWTIVLQGMNETVFFEC